MASQWDPSNFKSLHMSEILGYPRQIPPWYVKWIPKFTGDDEVKAEEHEQLLGLFSTPSYQ